MRVRRFQNRVPRRSIVNPLSSSAIKTLIVTLQGVGALYTITRADYALHLSLATIFSPLAILGLLRLPAALWLTDDRAFSDLNDLVTKGTMLDQQSIPATRSTSTSNLLFTLEDDPATIRFRPANGLHALSTRVFYVLIILALTGYTLSNLSQIRPSSYLTTTYVINLTYYCFLMVSASLILTFYVVRGNTTSITIPCITSTWYRIYTAVLFLGMLVMFMFGMIETRNTWCGTWTTYPFVFPGEGGYIFNTCPLARYILTEKLILEWNNGKGNRELVLNDTSGFIIAGISHSPI